MGHVADVLKTKGTAVHSIAPDATVYDAIARMARLRIGALLVVEGADDIRGIITERDYLTKVVLMNRSSRTTAVSQIMSTPVSTVDPQITVDECLALLTERRHRHMPVVEDGRLVGLVSVGDLVKYRVDEQRTEIQHLTDYVCGSYPR